MNIKEFLNKKVTFGILIKFMICLNIVVLSFCYTICNIRTTQDQETLQYIEDLEKKVEKQHDSITEYHKLIMYYKNKSK